MTLPEDVRTNFCVMVIPHTEDLHKVIAIPERLRELVGSALDRHGLQEEIDYTLDVYRTESDKDVTTWRIASLTAELDAMRIDRDLWRDDHEGDCPYKIERDSLVEALDAMRDARDLHSANSADRMREVERLRVALMSIKARFDAADKGTLHIRDGVVWAMASDARDALAKETE